MKKLLAVIFALLPVLTFAASGSFCAGWAALAADNALFLKCNLPRETGAFSFPIFGKYDKNPVGTA